MAGPSHTEPSMEDLWSRFSLEEEESGGLVIDDIGGSEDSTDLRWCLVGRFLTDRSINVTAMKNTLASIWRPVKGVCIKDLNPNLFLFQFFHELDLQRVMVNGPWTFNQHVLVFKRLELGEQPTKVPLLKTDFWVQVYDLPVGFMSERVGKNIGNYIGTYIESDPNNFGGIWRNYMRIRVSMDVRLPLKRKMKIKKAGGDWAWIEFKYERLPTFCFFCGLLGHSVKFCEKFFDCPDPSFEKPFGPWLRAPHRRNESMVGEKWLRTEAPVKEAGAATEDQDHMVIDLVRRPQTAKLKEIIDEHKESIEGNGGINGGKKGGGDMQLLYGNEAIVQNTNLEGDPQNAGIVVSEIKRRRTGEEGDSGVGVDVVPVSSPIMVEGSGPKNLELAGPVHQACQNQ